MAQDLSGEAWVVSGLHPDHPDTSFIIIPIEIGISPMHALMDRGYEGDGAFYLLTSEVWATREVIEEDLVIQLFWCGQDDPILRRVIHRPDRSANLAVTTLLVSARSGDSRSEVLHRLRTGEDWPVVVGPPASADVPSQRS